MDDALPTGQKMIISPVNMLKRPLSAGEKTNLSMFLISLSAPVQEINESDILSTLSSCANKIHNVMGIQWGFLTDQYQTFQARELINHLRLSIIKAGRANKM